MPGLYRKKCKACQDDNSKKYKRCRGAQSPGRPRGNTASEGYGVQLPVVHEEGNSKYQATGVSSGQEAPKTASLCMC